MPPSTDPSRRTRSRPIWCLCHFLTVEARCSDASAWCRMVPATLWTILASSWTFHTAYMLLPVAITDPMNPSPPSRPRSWRATSIRVLASSAARSRRCIGCSNRLLALEIRLSTLLMVESFLSSLAMRRSASSALGLKLRAVCTASYMGTLTLMSRKETGATSWPALLKCALPVKARVGAQVWVRSNHQMKNAFMMRLLQMFWEKLTMVKRN